MISIDLYRIGHPQKDHQLLRQSAGREHPGRRNHSWALEVGEVGRFSSIAQATSYCGLTSAQRSSADKEQRGPISKQRNKHLQTILIEAAKLAPRYNPQLAAVHERALQRGNRATLAVARKLLAHLMAVDKSGNPFQLRIKDEEQGEESQT